MGFHVSILFDQYSMFGDRTDLPPLVRKQFEVLGDSLEPGRPSTCFPWTVIDAIQAAVDR